MCLHHFGGTKKPEAWKANAVMGRHCQDRPAIEACSEGHCGVDLTQNAKYALPNFWPWWGISEIGSRQSMDVCKLDATANLYEGLIAICLPSQFESRRSNGADLHWGVSGDFDINGNESIGQGRTSRL